jgi:signal transduction histidine kinase
MLNKTYDMIHIDSMKLKQVIYNLLSNAVKYSLQGTIKIKVRLLSFGGVL